MGAAAAAMMAASGFGAAAGVAAGALAGASGVCGALGAGVGSWASTLPPRVSKTAVVKDFRANGDEANMAILVQEGQGKTLDIMYPIAGR